MIEQANTEIVEVRLVRVELVAYYEARDADGDPVGPAIAYSDKEGKPMAITGKAIAGLHAALQEQAPKILSQLRAEESPVPLRPPM